MQNFVEIGLGISEEIQIAGETKGLFLIVLEIQNSKSIEIRLRGVKFLKMSQYTSVSCNS